MAQKRTVHVFSKIGGLAGLLQKAANYLEVVDIRPPKDNIDLVTYSDASQEELKILQEVEILIADPGMIYNATRYLTRLKWMQSTWAGVDGLIKNLEPLSPAPKFQLTRLAGPGMFGPDMAEYVVGHIVAYERQFRAIYDDQKVAQWTSVVRHSYRRLSDLSIAIVGLGDIGKEVAKACHFFRMKVTGVVRKPRDNNLPFVDKISTLEEMDEILGSHDYICSVLPSTPQTRGLFNGTFLEAGKHKKPCLISVGRGDVITEESLIHAIENGWLSGAILDVFPEEPLSASSRLWSQPNVTMTPHVAAVTHPHDVVKVFLDNYKCFTNSKVMNHLVDWNAGY